MTARAPQTVRIERVSATNWQWYIEADSNIALEQLGWTQTSEHELTVENRGLYVRLRTRERLVWDDKLFYGFELRGEPITLRVWHDGSITEER